MRPEHRDSWQLPLGVSLLHSQTVREFGTEKQLCLVRDEATGLEREFEVNRRSILIGKGQEALVTEARRWLAERETEELLGKGEEV